MAARRITSKLRAAQAVSRVGRKLQAKVDREKRLKSRIARHKAKLDKLKAEQSELIRQADDSILQDAVALLPFYRETADELPSTAGPTVNYGTGDVLIRTVKTGALEFTGTEEECVDEITRLFPELFDKFVETKHTIRKNDLKDDKEVLDQLTTAWAGESLFFLIKPDNTSKTLSIKLSDL